MKRGDMHQIPENDLPTMATVLLRWAMVAPSAGVVLALLWWLI